jgi:hypothetical protein
MGIVSNVIQLIGRPESGARSALARNQADIINAEGQMLHLRAGMAKIDENLARFKLGQETLAAEVNSAAAHLTALARAGTDWLIGQVAGARVHSAASKLGDSAVEVAVLERSRANIIAEIDALEARLIQLRDSTRGLAIDAAAKSASVFYENHAQIINDLRQNTVALLALERIGGRPRHGRPVSTIVGFGADDLVVVAAEEKAILAAEAAWRRQVDALIANPAASIDLSFPEVSSEIDPSIPYDMLTAPERRRIDEAFNPYANKA